VAQAYDVQNRQGGRIGNKVYAEDLNLKKHVLTGYTVTDNTPTAGSIAWASLHVVYNGTDYAITDANTALKYAWFDPTASSTVLQTSNTKPTNLTGAATLVFVNNGGTAIIAVDSAMPAAVQDGAIDRGAILVGAVGSSQLDDGAVVSAKIASGAVGSGAIASGAVTSGKIGSGAVGSTELATGAVTSGKLGSKAVGQSNIADSAVGSTQIAGGAVGSTQIASNAVTSGKIASGAVGNTQLASDAVGSGNIQTGAVGATQLGAGAITAPKLNLLSHVLY
ncbi:MAG TPA: hypothetical protein VFN80_03275, partial [Acidothermaceae bacterium]|nr:hypothetical protein [Acidothermaceae bacterium]